MMSFGIAASPAVNLTRRQCPNSAHDVCCKSCVTRERLLIVVADPVQRRLLDNMVRKFGYEPVLAEGGDAALAVLSKQDGAPVDAIVLDLVMPDLDGLGVLAKMREAGLTVPVIVQTAHGGIDNVVTAM